ncbi:MAG: hypothetical protein JJE49_05240, partial [Peptostreptococcaceae bacterium]|nr:hypothetical protein [Peptostreptococcaceae bacterium]
MLKNLESIGMDSATKMMKVGDSEISPRDFLVKVVPSPVESTLKMTGQGCAGTGCNR